MKTRFGLSSRFDNFFLKIVNFNFSVRSNVNFKCQSGWIFFSNFKPQMELAPNFFWFSEMPVPDGHFKPKIVNICDHGLFNFFSWDLTGPNLSGGPARLLRGIEGWNLVYKVVSIGTITRAMFRSYTKNSCENPIVAEIR